MGIEHPIVSSESGPPLTHEGHAQKRAEMVDAFFSMTQHPPGDSTYFQAFAVAALECTLNPDRFTDFNEVLDELIAYRSRGANPLDIPHQAQLLRINYVYALRKHGTDFPDKGEDPVTWLHWFDTVLQHKLARGMLEDANISYNNGATDERRYAGMKIGMKVMADILPDRPLDIFDAGCSAGIGGIQLGENLPFINVRFNAKPEIRKLGRRALNEWLDIGRNVGADIYPNGDIPHVEAASYYIEEYRNTARRDRRAKLYQYRKGYRIIPADITGLADQGSGLQTVKEIFPGGQADIGMEVTSWYMLPKEHVSLATKNLDDLSRFITLAQDKAVVDPARPSQLAFASDIYAPSTKYGLFVKQTQVPGAKQELLGTWDSFRCNVFTPSAFCVDKLVQLYG